MSGTPEGGRKSRDKLLAADPNHYEKLARKALRTRGGAPTPGSFDSASGRAGGKKGGKISKRPKGKQADVQVDGPLDELSL